MSGRGGERFAGEALFRGHALERGIDGGEHDRRPRAALDPRKARERRHALGDDGCVRRNAIVGLAIPGRQFQHVDVGREEAERARERRHARTFAADDQKAGRRRERARGDGAGEVGDDETFGAVGDVRERQRPVGLQQFGGGFGHRSYFACR